MRWGMSEKQRLLDCCQCQPALRLTMQCKISLVFNTSQMISTRRWANPGWFVTPMIQKKFWNTLERRIHFIMAGKSRLVRDTNDTEKVWDYLGEKNPFHKGDSSLCNFATGETATKEVNVCDVKKIGQ